MANNAEGKRPITAPQEEPEPSRASAEQLDKAWSATKKKPPQWSMRGKPNMIPGDAVPSWVRSIPGPKYNIDTDAFKPRAPSWGFSQTDFRGEKKQKEAMKKSASAPSTSRGPTCEQIDKGWAATTKNAPPQWSLGTKPEMVIGGSVPSWTNSIPGPKYMYDSNTFKARQPVYTLGGKLEFVSGGSIPSWVKSIPGPKYTYDTDKFKNRRPTYTIGEKLPTEGEIMSKRSPGPIYEGPVTDAAKQSLVDSSKKRTCAPSFGVGSRSEGKHAAMVRSGALGRFEHGKFAFG